MNPAAAWRPPWSSPRFDGAEWVSRMWIRAANDDVNGLGAFVRGRR